MKMGKKVLLSVKDDPLDLDHKLQTATGRLCNLSAGWNLKAK